MGKSTIPMRVSEDSQKQWGPSLQAKSMRSFSSLETFTERKTNCSCLCRQYHYYMVERQWFLEKLSIEFEMMDIGVLKHFLGIKVAYSLTTRHFFLAQWTYVLDLLQETCKFGC